MNEDASPLLGGTGQLSAIRHFHQRVQKKRIWIVKPSTLRKCVFAVVVFSIIMILIYLRQTRTPYLTK